MTNEQSQAVFKDNGNILVSASAGSGKTFTMIERVKRLVIDQGVGVDQILAVTFTEMAASEMKEKLIALLGGRAAEKLVLDDISTGASNDIEVATQIARDMVTKYGMSETIGSIMFGSGQEEVFLGRDFAQSKNYSEETAAVIDVETKKIIDNAYNRAVKILTENIDKLHTVAGILLEKEKIDGEEFDQIFGE